jgi:hypothetical protein
VLATGAGAARPAAGAGAPNAIQRENASAGTPGGLTPSATAGGAIDGYATETSALPGDTLHFHVSTSPAAPYRIEVYRLGWYGGAGARLIGCAPSCGGLSTGQPLPPAVPDGDGVVRARWPTTDTFALPADAVSGYYRVRFVLPDGRATSTFVIVRAPASAPSSILVQVPVNTWQAYNSWGGRSLYDLPGAQRSNRVSFERPYAWSAPGNQSPLGWEYPLVLFLEQNGYDVSYQTDADTDADPSSLLGHRLVIVAGHDEYWTQTMRNAFEAARDAGVNLAFMGANDAYWRVRYEDGGRTIVDYKAGGDPVSDPARVTGYFRVFDRPECKLIGIQHQGGELDWPPGNYGVVAGSLGHPWFRNTGFTAAGVVQGVVGVETDTIPQWDGGASCGHALTVFFHHDGGGDTHGNADATAYTVSSGATVFAAGSKRFAWGLADPPPVTGRMHGLVDPRLQAFVRNMLDDLSARRTTRLHLTLSARSATAQVGARVQVVAAISNSGPDGAPAMSLDVTLPSGLAFVRIAAAHTHCTLVPLHCALPELDAGATMKASIVLRVTAPGAELVSARVAPIEASDPVEADGAGRLVLRCHVAVAVTPE